MSIKNKIVEVINKHKNGVCFLLGIKPNDLYAEDISVMANFLTYKAGAPHTLANGGPDKDFLDAIRQLPPEKKCERVLIEACAWKENGELRSKSLSEALKAPPIFSPRVESALEKMRIKTYDKECRSMAKKSALLAQQMRKVETLLLGEIVDGVRKPREFSDPDFRREIREETKKINHIFTGMNYHLKGVMFYTVKSGYSPKEAGNIIHSVYLDRVKKIFKSLSAVDDTLNMNNMTSNLSKRALKEHQKWSDLIDDFTENNGEPENEKLHAQQL